MKTESITLATIAIIIIMMTIPNLCQAQRPPDNEEGYHQPMSYDHVREADVMWMKRIWRRVDLRQKMNHPLYFPEKPADGRKSLFDYIAMAVTEGSIAAYDPGPLGEDDMFTRKFTPQEIRNLLVSTELAVTESIIYPGQFDTVEVTTQVKSSDVIMYEIKEDWFFDRERSVMEVRIVGICPMMRIVDDYTGEFRGYKRLFWISFQESRYEMSNWLAFNRQNDMEQRNYDQIFNKRFFASYIVKESNVYNRYIHQYKQGVAAMLESERIHEDLMIMEHDLWSY